MNKILVILLAFCMTGCATVTGRLVTRDGVLKMSDGNPVKILGNPPITCYDKHDHVISNGYFMYQEGDFVTVDEFGKEVRDVYLNGSGNYCELW